VPDNSLNAMPEEMNRIATADPYEDAMASVVKMFGESFEAEANRETWEYCDLKTRELRRADADARHLLDLAERFARLRGHAELIFSDQNPNHATAFVVLFRALEDKLYEIQLARAALAVTVDIPSVARQLKGLPADLQQAAIDRREWDRSDARSETGQKGGESARPSEKATRDFAISLWEKAPDSASVRSVAINIEAAVVAHALKLGWEMAPDNHHRAIYGWLLAAKRERLIK